jgi:hypothetical protein
MISNFRFKGIYYDADDQRIYNRSKAMINEPVHSGITIDSYNLERVEPSDIRMQAAQAARETAAMLRRTATESIQLPIKITLKVQGFFVSAVEPKIMIGDVELKDYELLSNQTIFVGYLYEIPPEGSVISIEYRGSIVEMSEPFSLSKLIEGDSPNKNE